MTKTRTRPPPLLRQRSVSRGRVPATWALRHLQTLLATLGALVRSPLGTLMTAAVIGIALALPTGLYVLLQNAQHLGRGWDGAAQISVFLKSSVDDAQAEALAQRVRSAPQVASVDIITRAEALEEYRRLSGFEEVLAAFADENPLPAVLVVRLASNPAASDAVSQLMQSLKDHPEVDLAEFDLQWVKRLHAVTRIVQRGVLVLAALLALGVLLIVGNTIRLGIQNRRQEIEIAKLFGATDAFIRRPFLYTGLWYGLLGGVLAWAVVSLALQLMSVPINALATLYYSDFLMVTVDGVTTLAVLFIGAGLGLAGSWLAVGRHLHAIEPS